MRLFALGMLVMLATGCIEYGDGHEDTAVDAGQCALPLGRRCIEGQICFGGQGNDCNYFICQRGQVSATSVDCSMLPASQPLQLGQNLECRPGLVRPNARGEVGAVTPCPLGQLQTTSNGRWGGCVAVRDCMAWPCDPGVGDGDCPTGQACDGVTARCR